MRLTNGIRFKIVCKSEPAIRICIHESNGTEVDFVLRLRGRTVAVECKASSAPAVTRGNTLALDDIRPDRAFVAAPVVASYALSPVWTVLAPADLPAVFDESFAP